MSTESTDNTYYPPSDAWSKQNNAESVSSNIVSDLIRYQNIADARAQALVARAAPPLPHGVQSPTEFSVACDALGKMSRIDRPMAVDMAKVYIQNMKSKNQLAYDDMEHKNQLACGDQEFNHARLMYQEKRAGWMMSAVLTTLIACGVISAIFFVLSEMTQVPV
jgi:hypothetical protein